MITVMTTVYNRAYIIEHLYKSLLRQTSSDFEWLIIDDGSTDNLKALCEKWSVEMHEFEIHYVYRENGGKHRAWNTGLQYIHGDYVFVVDSDDYLLDNAIEKLISWIEQIDRDERFAGVSGNKGYYKGNSLKMHGTYPANKKFVDATNLQRYYKKLNGDKAEVYRTSILKKYPFPEFEGEIFCSEGAVYGRIAHDGYKLRWFPDIICICEYLEDGLMNNHFEDRERYFWGYAYVVRQSAKYEQFPLNYLEIGGFSKTAQKRGISEKEAAELINVSIIKFKISKALFFINAMRNGIRK